MSNYLSRACHTWAQEGKLTGTVLHNLQSHIGSQHNGSAWMLLGLISGHVACRDPDRVLDYFNLAIASPEGEGVGLFTLLQVLKVLFSSVTRLSPEDQTTLQCNLIDLVGKFKIPSELISKAVDVITVVSSLQVPAEAMKRYQSAVDGWAVPMLERIHAYLSSVLLQGTETDHNSQPDEDLLTRQIFTLGELAQVSPHRITPRMFLVMKSIVFQDNETSTAAVPCTQDTQPATQQLVLKFEPSARLQALAVITLGKMCLQHEGHAKKIIPAFGQILATSSDPAIKNNIMFALADMCVRYASLVDPLLPQMTACLKDRNVSVRKTTLIQLIHLLQEDYLKIRGNGKFFFRILQTMRDKNLEMRNLTTFYIQQRLLKRLPKIISSFFVESLFVFNDFQEHGSYNKFVTSDQEKQIFSLSGDKCQEDRHELYKFMLDNMDDEQRFTTIYKLCQDVLGGVVDGAIRLSATSLPLLRDTFHCLGSDSIKLASLKSKGPEEEAETEQDMAGKIMEAAKKKIISDVVKKNVMENVVPIIIGLKHKLEECQSPLLKELFEYLRILMEDYKNEVSDILSADRQLAKEIEFDMKNYEKQEQERREREERQKLRRSTSSTRSSLPNSPARSPATHLTPEKNSIATPGRGDKSVTPKTPGSTRTPRRRPNLAKIALQNAMAQSAKKTSKSKTAKAGLDISTVSTMEENLEPLDENVDVQCQNSETEPLALEPTKDAGSNANDSVSGDSTKPKKDTINTLSEAKDADQTNETDDTKTLENTTSDKSDSTDDEHDGKDSTSEMANPSNKGKITEAVRENIEKPKPVPTSGDIEKQVRENKMKIAGIRVKINEYRDIIDEAVKEKDYTRAQEIKEVMDALSEDQKKLENEMEKLLNPPDIVTENIDEVNEVNISRRISGRGIERQDVNKKGTPKKGAKNKLRAVSTPQTNKTVNITFMEESANLSSITGTSLHLENISMFL